VLSRKNFLTGQPPAEGLPKDVIWWNAQGREMIQDDWDSGFVSCFGMVLSGGNFTEIDETGASRKGDSVCILMNAHHEDLDCILPPAEGATFWKVRLTTQDGKSKIRARPGKKFRLQSRSLTVFIAPVPATT